jgi:hypothetical protein
MMSTCCLNPEIEVPCGITPSAYRMAGILTVSSYTSEACKRGPCSPKDSPWSPRMMTIDDQWAATRYEVLRPIPRKISSVHSDYKVHETLATNL